MESLLQHIYQGLLEMDPVSCCVFVICQAKHMQLPSSKEQQITINLDFSKARNAPKKKFTILMLALMSILIGTRNLRFAAKAMRLEKAEKYYERILNIY